MDYELDLDAIDPEGVGAVNDMMMDFIPGFGLAADAASGLIYGDQAVADQQKNEQLLANIYNDPLVQESGMADLYDGVTELPGVSDIVKSQRSMDRYATKYGAFVHESVAGLFD